MRLRTSITICDTSIALSASAGRQPLDEVLADPEASAENVWCAADRALHGGSRPPAASPREPSSRYANPAGQHGKAKRTFGRVVQIPLDVNKKHDYC